MESLKYEDDREAYLFALRSNLSRSENKSILVDGSEFLDDDNMHDVAEAIGATHVRKITGESETLKNKIEMYEFRVK